MFGGDQDAALANVLFELAVGGQRNTFHGRQNQDGIRNAGVGDGAIVDEIEVVSGVEDSGHEIGAEELVHGLVDGDSAGREGGPGVIGGDVYGHIVGRLAVGRETWR